MRYLVLFVLLISVAQVVAQEQQPVSIQIQATTKYYTFGSGRFGLVFGSDNEHKNYRSKFNHGATLLVSKQYSPRTKLCSGIGYSTYNFSTSNNPVEMNNGNYKSEFYLTYIHIPILVRKYFINYSLIYGINSNIRMQNYRLDFYRNKATEKTYFNDVVDGVLYAAFHLEGIYAIPLNNKCNLNISPFLDYVLGRSKNTNERFVNSSQLDRLSFGLNIGMEIVLKK